MSKKVGGLKDGVLSLAGSVREGTPLPKGAFKFRYVRDWLNGSSANNYNHWVEIKVFDKAGTNIALGKKVYDNEMGREFPTKTTLTDNVTHHTPWSSPSEGAGNKTCAIVDLEGYYDIDKIISYHYWADGRTYYDTKIEVSADGVNYYTVFDSAVSGTYPETENGKTVYVPHIGLDYTFPFEGSMTGRFANSRNLIDTSRWTVRATIDDAIEGFSRNGLGNENQIIEYENPWGYKEIMWATPGNDAESNADGGFTTAHVPIDKTKKYRASIWVRKENAGDGRVYFGPLGATVSNMSTTTGDANPYFVSFVSNPTDIADDQWALLVYYIYPTGGTDTNLAESGIYSINGEFIRTGQNFRWLSTATTSGIRSYLYYSTKVDEKCYWCRPRLELCDGKESTIEELLSGFDDAFHPTTAAVDGIDVDAGGFHCDSPSSSLVSNTVQPGVYNNHGATMSIRKLDEEFRGLPVYRVSYKATNATQLNSVNSSLQAQGVVSPSTTYAANTPYAYGAYWRKVNKEDMTLGGVASNIGAWYDNGSYEVEDGWMKWSRHRVAMTAAATDHGHISVRCPSLKLNETMYFDVAGIQLEANRRDITAPIPAGSTRVNLSFAAAKELKPPFTINVFHRSDVQLQDIVSQATSCRIFQVGDYYGNPSMTLWNFSKNLTLFTKADTGSAWESTTGLLTYTPATWDRQEHMYTLVMEDTKTIKVYMDGVLLGTKVNTNPMTKFGYLYLSPEGFGSSTYRNLDVYNVALAADQVKSIYNKGFSINRDGDMPVKKLIEGYDLGADFYYVPLNTTDVGVEGVLKGKQVSPVYDTETYIGPGIQNWYNNPLMEANTGWSTWGVTGHIGQIGQTKDPMHLFEDGKQSFWVSNDAGATGNFLIHQQPGETMTAGPRSAKWVIKMSDGSPVTHDKCFPAWNGRDGGAPSGLFTSIERIGDSEWYLCKVENTSQNGTNNLMGIYVKPGYKIYIARAKFEQNKWCTPGWETFGDAHLKFDLNTDIEMDWSKDYTIMYWKKPLKNDSSEYNIESLGLYNNQVGGGYIWWGKSSVAGNSHSRPAFTFTDDQYYNKWQFVVLRKSDDVLSFMNYNEKGFFKEDLGNAVTTANYYKNSGGFDLDLSGYSFSALTGKAIKDLLIVKKGLTDNEIDKIYRNQMSNKNGVMRISDSIKETI